MMMKPIQKKKEYFEGLDSIRFIAASLVFITHIEFFKMFMGYENYYSLALFQELGAIGVSVFFVLSGFLITHLLLIEKRKYREISVKNFYVRRFLRIAPLYFLVFILGFWVLPPLDIFYVEGLSALVHNDIYEKMLLYIFFLPQLLVLLYAYIPFVVQSWAIGTEVQFYLFWPWLIKKSGKLLKTMLLLFFIFIFIKYLMRLIPWFWPESVCANYTPFINGFLYLSRFECIICGAIAAVIWKEYPDHVKKILFSGLAELLSLLGFLYIVFCGRHLGILDHVLVSVFAALIIVNVAFNKKSILWIPSALLHYLGKASYSFYMLHQIVIVAAIRFMGSYNALGGLHENILLYLISFSFSWLLAVLFYELFEKMFLKIKSAY
jgi:peptidoglycan/LPS O-acetylase OafA/YrhL